ncbi:tetratricopeptide repeat protein [Desulfovibrio sp. OttesenSCG-928-G11]|nr:tetratricopeptide repeat protein [Desulfovibrio sp. OttesenSCG-928-G11]
MAKKLHRFSGSAFRALLFCLAVCLLLWSAPEGRAAGADKAQASPAHSAADIARLLDPSALALGPEAERLYYYLVLASALSENDQSVIPLALKGLLKLDPSLEVFQDSATILLARREWAAAEAMAKDGLGHFPGNGLLTLLLSGAYSESGRLPEAVRLLEGFLKKNPGHIECSEELVKLYLKDGQKKKAAELLAKLPDAGSKPESELFRAGVLASVGRLGEARQVLQGLLEKNPAFFEAWLELAYVFTEEDKPDEAINAYMKAAQFMPDSPDLWLRVAMLQLGAGRPQEALQTLEKTSPGPEMYLHSAARFAEHKHYAQAEELILRSRKTGGDPDECSLLLSMVRQESGSTLEQALAPLKDIDGDSAFYPAALEQKARLYLVYKDYSKAASEAAKARQAFPERRELWGIEAYAMLRQDKVDKAEALLTTALERYPEDEDLLFSLGSVQHDVGKDQEAMRTMERLIKVNPRNYQALNYVGYVLAEQGRELNRAYTLIAAALEQRPEAAFIVDSMAWVQFKLGRHEEAWQSINRCLALGADEATIWEHYGDIALALGKNDEAAKGYKEAIARQPDNEAELRKKLTGLEKK